MWAVLGGGLFYYLALARPSILKTATKVALICLFYLFSSYVAFEVHEGVLSPRNYLLVAPAALIAVVVLVGALVPRSYVLTRAAEFHQPPEAIWQAITNYENFPSWLRGQSVVSGVTARPPHVRQPGCELRYRGYGGTFKVVTLEVDEMVPNQRLVTRFANPTRGMDGTWTYEISATPAGSHLRITERGKIRGAVGRFMWKLVSREVGHPRTMTDYLLFLGWKFREDVTVVA